MDNIEDYREYERVGGPEGMDAFYAFLESLSAKAEEYQREEDYFDDHTYW